MLVKLSDSIPKFLKIFREKLKFRMRLVKAKIFGRFLKFRMGAVLLHQITYTSGTPPDKLDGTQSIASVLQ